MICTAKEYKDQHDRLSEENNGNCPKEIIQFGDNSDMSPYLLAVALTCAEFAENNDIGAIKRIIAIEIALGVMVGRAQVQADRSKAN